MSEENSKRPEQQNTEIAIVDEKSIRDKIYVVRGVQVMLDFELAELYGYTTSAFNQQVKRNEDKFPEDFRFQLTKEEFQNLLSQNVTASWGGDRSTEPWCFSESGIYRLMTVLKGDCHQAEHCANSYFQGYEGLYHPEPAPDRAT